MLSGREGANKTEASKFPPCADSVHHLTRCGLPSGIPCKRFFPASGNSLLDCS
jgi:hypothetical protein